ncbi:MAG: protein jag [Spirochaetales bacterium]|nr:protein jag [Spirochaetales bacterium]
MIREFEGLNEEDAISNAVKSLGLNREELDIEVIENKKPILFFGKAKVRIRVFVDHDLAEEGPEESPDGEFKGQILEFIEELVKYMDLPGKVSIHARNESKYIVNIKSAYSAILIGKKGKTLDAIQLLANIYASKVGNPRAKIIIDTEDYRSRREKSLISLAHRVAEQVRRTRNSVLLEAMNPFERRLIHTTLNKRNDIETVSEGDGLYKKIRVLYKGRYERRGNARYNR